jgi:hypothetical protein
MKKDRVACSSTFNNNAAFSTDLVDCHLIGMQRSSISRIDVGMANMFRQVLIIRVLGIRRWRWDSGRGDGGCSISS